MIKGSLLVTRLFITAAFCCALTSCASRPIIETVRPPDFVDVAQVNPTIKIDMRYFSDWNFTGRRVDGYQANKCLLTRAAAEALSRVQDFLNRRDYSLVMFDCYRPQRAVDNFVKWASDLKDLKYKRVFYPEEPKETLFQRGYIAYHSGHSRGSTIDLSIVRIDQAEGRRNFHEKIEDCRRQRDITQTGQLDMGTTVDCFSELANTANPGISPEAAKNREILKSAMENFGFVNYDKEWWHYTLKDEPYKEKYFDFVVK